MLEAEKNLYNHNRKTNNLEELEAYILAKKTHDEITKGFYLLDKMARREIKNLYSTLLDYFWGHDLWDII